MELSLNCPLNSVSFGQVSTALLREAYKKEIDVLVALLGDRPDLSSQGQDPEFFQWVERAIRDFNLKHYRTRPSLKLWHLNGSLSYISENQAVMTFHELDSLTHTEANIGKNVNKLLVTSKYTQEVLLSKDIKSYYVPLGFDHSNFHRKEKSYYSDERIVFNLSGKFEFRKRHAKVLRAWASKFGNDKRYMLQAAVFNPFLNQGQNNELISGALGDKKYFNMSFIPSMDTNASYNDYLNSGDIIIGMSGGEGWGLPEFQSVAIGKHSVILNAHSYKGWANTENSVLVEPDAMIDCVDDIFFKKGQEFNQGKIFDWNEDDFISGCEEAIKRVEANRLNEEGLKLQEEFKYSNTLDKVIEVLKE